MEAPRLEEELGLEEPKPCCVYLRCKSVHYRADERPGLLHVDESMGYWCVKMADSLGPDGLLATHKGCQEGRACHEGKGGGAKFA